jgi:hypothetical protein
MRHAVSLVLRVLALTVVLFVGLSVGAVVSGVSQAAATMAPGATPPADDGQPLGPLLLSCVAISVVFSWSALRVRLVGWRLAGSIFLAVFGLGTFLPQSETAMFLSKHLPSGFVPRLFAMGLVSGAIFSPAVAWIVRRPREGPLLEPPPRRVAPIGWPRITLLAAAYVAAYFLAGYFIAYRNPALVAYYGDTDPGSLLAQVGKVWATVPWLFPFQAVRGMLFVACVAPFILTFLGGRVELALWTGCAYSVWALMLLTPNPYMPATVRMSHLVETATSNFLFGCLVGGLLAPVEGLGGRGSSD